MKVEGCRFESPQIDNVFGTVSSSRYWKGEDASGERESGGGSTTCGSLDPIRYAKIRYQGGAGGEMGQSVRTTTTDPSRERREVESMAKKTNKNVHPDAQTTATGYPTDQEASTQGVIIAFTVLMCREKHLRVTSVEKSSSDNMKL